MTPETGRQGRDDQTTKLLRQAREGDRDSCDALVSRVSPPLLLMARHRLKCPLNGIVSAEDVVQEAWMVALPRLRDLEPRDGRLTPVLMRFLATTVAFIVRDLQRRHARNLPLRQDDSEKRQDPEDHRWSSASSRLRRSEEVDRVLAVLTELSPEEQEVVVLRAVEQLPNVEAAARLGITPGGVTRRYQRAVDKLRVKLNGSVFNDLQVDD